MSFADGVRYRLRALFRSSRLSHDLDREQQFHRDLDEMQARHLGADDAEARAAARRRFGNATYFAEEARAVTRIGWIDRLNQNLRYASRQLTRTPVLTTTIVLTFGLGIGANAAVFSFIHRALLAPPAGVVRPDDVHLLYGKHKPLWGLDGLETAFAYPVFVAMRDAIGNAAQVSAVLRSRQASLTSGGVTATVWVDHVTAGYLPMLVGQAARGRFFSAAEDSVTAPQPVAVVSYNLWRSAFSGDSAILGRVVHVEDQDLTVIGVAPRGFSGIQLDATDIWVPGSLPPHAFNRGADWYQRRDGYISTILVRSAPGRTLAQVTARATAAYRNQYPGSDLASTAILAAPIIHERTPWRDKDAMGIAERLAVVVLIVLLVACANVATLLLVRASRRRREIGVRLALGISRGRLVEQLATESLLAALGGGALALLVAHWTGSVLRALLLPTTHWRSRVVDWPTLLFVVGVTATIGIVCGLVPGLQASRPELTGALKPGPGEITPSGNRLRAVLLTAQTALALVLVVDAGIFLRSLHLAETLDLGYDRAGLIGANPSDVSSRDGKAQVAAGLTKAAIRLRAMPGILGAAVASGAPNFLQGGSIYIKVPGIDSAALAKTPPLTVFASPEYLGVMRTKLLDGRGIRESDTRDAPPVAVVSQSLARRLWPGKSAVGRCMENYAEGMTPQSCVTVVGVVEDIHQWGVSRPPHDVYIRPLAQSPSTFLLARVLAVRVVPGTEVHAIDEIRQVMRAEIPQSTQPTIATFNAQLDRDFRRWRLGALLFSAMGILAIVVAGVGVYSGIAYAFAERTREIGIRMTLGAHASQVVRLVLGEALRIVGVGVVIGIGLSLASAQLLAAFVFGISPRDPVALGAATIGLLALGLVAAAGPAWRASRVDPMAVLTVE
jgi:predicted permease